MVIVRIQGGLANQMFQYTFYYWLKQKHEDLSLSIETFCDTSMYYHDIPEQEADPVHNGYELQDVFGIEVDSAKLQDVYRLSSYRYGKIRRAAIRARTMLLGKISTQIMDDEKGDYCRELATLDNKYFCGTWGSFKYAEEYEDQIRRIFTFPEIVDTKNKNIMNRITSSDSVSVHVRRGDYLKVGGGIALDKDYWDGAIARIREIIPHPVFFFFSDDIEWCKSCFISDDYVFVDWNPGKESFRDMQLMSMCKHNIIANSTFSLWASWLNRNEGKIVIKP